MSSGNRSGTLFHFPDNIRASRSLDSKDRGAKICQDHAGKRSWKEGSKVENLQLGQGTGHGSIKGDDGLSGKRLFSRSFCSEFKSDPVLTEFIEFFNDFPATGNLISYQSHCSKSCFQFTDGGLTDPVGKQSAKISHRKHPMCNHVVQPGFLGIINIYMNRIVVA